ncbi:ABC transporter substrate-binding protein [Cohnella silvisoli]|uniref:Sugar ABC transporter substrate-binding protein n=1 Tax=Cohnella silvisoli TaxID=2873699 RepID=A0ABV1KT26_9BACL|nr:sugar ABC transporter substrate-binding protein [Cohnella silvisoli]MCD9021394.1 sugar ABC transporter substrate-binding protein [Cohnella silvisoli]
MRKNVLMILSLVLVFTLAACGSSKNGETASKEAVQGSGKKVEVTMWRTIGSPEEDKYFNELVDSFNKSQEKLVIKQTTFPGDTYHDQVHAAGLSKGLPDLLYLDGTEMSYMAYQGFLAPLDTYLPDDLKKDLLPSLIKQGTYSDGKLYLLGQFDSGLSFWANKKMLEQAKVRIPKGIDDAWSKTEFDDALAKLKAIPEIKFPLDLKINYGAGYWIYSYLPWVAGFGGNYMNADTKLSEGTLNGPQTVEAFQYLRTLIDKGYVNPTQTNDDDFFGKKVSALSLVGHWMEPTHKKELGDDAILVPFPNFGKGVFTGIGSLGWTITASAKEKGVDQQAWEVLSHFMSPENIKNVSAANGAVPARISVLNEIPDYQEGGRLYLYREQLEKGNGIVRPVTPAFSVFQKEIGQAAMDIVNGADVKGMLDKAAKAIDQSINDAGYNNK